MPQAVRDEIKTRHDVNFVVIAGAGTGKTTLLVDKLMALVRDGHAELSEIAAITFTEKAAAEIAVRVESEIETALARGHDPEGRLSRARDQLDSAAITTLHGFAGRMLRERPIDAGLLPDHDILDEVRTRLMFEEFYAAWETEQLSQVRATWRRLVEQRVDAALPGLAESFVTNLDILQDYTLDPPESVDVLAERLENAFSRICTELSGLVDFASDRNDRAVAIAERLLTTLPTFTRQRLRDPFRALRALDDLHLSRRKVGKKSGWATPEALKAVQAAVTDTLDAIDAYQAGWRHILAHDAWTVLREFLDAYQADKHRRGVVEFQDLLISARNMLRHRKEARKHFQARFKVLLVDEFQDTDPLQAEIVFFLAEDGARADTWKDVQLVPGKLFIVGDPKQSIYRFRRADVEVFEEVRARVKAQGGVEHTLKRNFRSLPGVVHFVNAFFSRHITRPDDGGTYQPDYDPMVPFRPGGDEPRVELIVHAPEEAGGDLGDTRKGRSRRRKADGFSADQARELEARMLAARLETMIGRERLVMDGDRRRVVRPGDIALLFRATTHLDVYTGAFQDRGLPVRVVGSTRFYTAQEVIDLANLLRAIASPHDAVALVGALRSPAFGFDDVLITHLARLGLLDYRRLDGLDTLAQRGLDGSVVDRVRRAYQTLQELHALRDRISMPALVSEALNRTSLLPVAYASFAGEQKVLNLEKVRSLARSYEAAGMRSLERFANTLLSAIVGRRQEEEMADTEVGDDVIRILTIHKAKGLEWPVVVVPGLMSSHRGTDDFLVHRAASEFGFRAGDAQTRNWEALKEYEAPRVDAERMRLFYVATTRARDYLILSGVTQNRQGKAAMLTLLSKFMEAQVGKDWRTPRVVTVDAGPPAPMEPEQGGPETARVRVGDTTALLDETPMSSHRQDLVTVVDRIDDPDTERRIPDVVASREVARQADLATRNTGAPPGRHTFSPPDSLARQAFLVAEPGASVSLETRLRLAGERASDSPADARALDEVGTALERLLQGPVADRLSHAKIWGMDVPLLFRLESGLVVETSVDVLYETDGGDAGALVLVPGTDSARQSAWLDAVIAGLGSLPAPRPGRLEVYDLKTGESARLDLTPERVETARGGLVKRISGRG